MKEEKRNVLCKFTIEQEKEICNRYIVGESTGSLAKEFVTTSTTIHRILKAYNISCRTLSEARRNYVNYTINEEAFSEINNPETSYWLGVMYSDGYISKGKYTGYFGISVKEDDVEWLLKFKNFLNYSGSIKHYKVTEGYKIGNPYVRLVIGNNKIVENLKKWGVIEQKTKKIAKIPNIPYKDDFIRGYIDGDGSLLRKRPCFQISGNGPFLLDIADYFRLPYRLYPDKSIFSLKYNTKESIYLEKRLYSNACCYLARKYEIAKRSFNSPITLEDVMKTQNIKETP